MKGEKQPEGSGLKKSSRARTGGKKFEYTKTKIISPPLRVLGCWNIWESGLSRMFQSCVENIVPAVCLLVQSIFEEYTVC